MGRNRYFLLIGVFITAFLLSCTPRETTSPQNYLLTANVDTVNAGTHTETYYINEQTGNRRLDFSYPNRTERIYTLTEGNMIVSNKCTGANDNWNCSLMMSRDVTDLDVKSRTNKPTFPEESKGYVERTADKTIMGIKARCYLIVQIGETQCYHPEFANIMLFDNNTNYIFTATKLELTTPQVDVFNLPDPVCSSEPADQKKECYREVAKTALSPFLCDKITEKDYRDSCRIEVAGLLKDITLCAEFNGVTKAACYEEVGIATQNISICNQISNMDPELMVQSDRDDCAIAIGDLATCQAMEEDAKTDCLVRVAIVRKDLELCNVPNEWRRQGCISSVGIKKQDMTICAQVTDEYFKDACFTNIAQLTNTSLPCASVTNESYKDVCYANTAQSSDGCNKVNNKDLKNLCLNVFKK